MQIKSEINQACTKAEQGKQGVEQPAYQQTAHCMKSRDFLSPIKKLPELLTLFCELFRLCKGIY